MSVCFTKNAHAYIYIHTHIVYGFDQRVARQRLGIHVPTRNNGNSVSVDECCSSLLDNNQHANKLVG
jgi:hypothetical protein